MRTMFYGKRKFVLAPLILIALALFGTVTMLLWNALMPVVFHLPEIEFWQAVGLLILARLFFGAGMFHNVCRNHTYSSKVREKIAKMTPEERREFFRNMHINHRIWHQEHCCEKKSSEDSNVEDGQSKD